MRRSPRPNLDREPVRVPDVGNRQARDQLERRAPIRPGVAADRGVPVAVGAEVAGLRFAELVLVELVPPLHLEFDPIRRVSTEGGTVPRPRAGAARPRACVESPQSSRWSPRLEEIARLDVRVLTGSAGSSGSPRPAIGWLSEPFEEGLDVGVLGRDAARRVFEYLLVPGRHGRNRIVGGE